MFNRKDTIQKRLLKIKKHEMKTLQTLEKQESELSKAVEENNQLIKAFLDNETKEEIVLKQEIESLTAQRDILQEKLSEVNNKVLFARITYIGW